MANTGNEPSRSPRYVSTGDLPVSVEIDSAVRRAYDDFRPVTDGVTSTVYPSLASVDPDLYGIALRGTSGASWKIGDADREFTIQSVSKPFVFALVCQELGRDRMRELVGVNATGRSFNSAIAVDESDDGRTNPMVNSGAIATTSLMPGADPEVRWNNLLEGLSRFAGRRLTVDEGMLDSASRSNFRNRGIANLLKSRERIYCDPAEAVALYTRQCCLTVSAEDLATMGATLANGGVNPLTGERVVDSQTCRQTLAVMTIAGLYESSGEWLYTVGLPGKSGIGGGIVTISPGKGGLAVFSPRLDRAGNSVRGQLATAMISRQIGLDLFISSAESTSER